MCIVIDDHGGRLMTEVSVDMKSVVWERDGEEQQWERLRSINSQVNIS